MATERLFTKAEPEALCVPGAARILARSPRSTARAPKPSSATSTPRTASSTRSITPGSGRSSSSYSSATATMR